MRKSIFRLFLASLFLVGSSGVASAILIHTATDFSTGTTYEFYYEANGISWGDAYSAAMDLGCMLAVVDSEAENNFVSSVVDTLPSLTNTRGLGPWLGGYAETPGNWQWVDGSPWVYENWYGVEPNFGEGGVAQGLIYFNGLSVGSGPYWADYGQVYAGGVNLPVVGYVVECAPVPEPSTFFLLGGGLLSLAFAVRRRKEV
jgi:hypothetical protein